MRISARPPSPRLPASLLLCMVAAGCTTHMEDAVNPYHDGQFDLAAAQVEKVAPSVAADGRLKGLEVEHKKDRLWAGLEKAKILQDQGSFAASLDLYTWVDAEAADLRKIESWYAQNPANPASWDAGQFLQDIGQTVVGADQTDYLLQPYEMILANSYMTLDALMTRRPAESCALSTIQLQEWEQRDLELAGEEVAQPDLAKLDTQLAGKADSGVPQGFSFQKAFQETPSGSTRDGFGPSKAALSEAIARAKATHCNDPRVAFGYLMSWAAYVNAGSTPKASAVREFFQSTCGASRLAGQMKAHESAKSQDFVLVVLGSGKAPDRDYFSVRIPIPIPNVGIGYYRGVYPFLRFRTDGRPRQFAVTAAGNRVQAEQIDSIDAIAARNFQRRELELWLIPTLRGVIRTAASMAGQKVLKDNDQGLAALGVAVAGLVVAEAEQADLRIWRTLPAEHHAVLVPRPADGKLRIDFDDGTTAGSIDTQVEPGTSLVYARVITPTRHTAAFCAPLRSGRPSGQASSDRGSASPQPQDTADAWAASTPSKPSAPTAAPARAATESPAFAPPAAPVRTNAVSAKPNSPRPPAPTPPPAVAVAAPATARPTGLTAPTPESPRTLTVVDLSSGQGPRAADGDLVSYHYTCSLTDGRVVFDGRRGAARTRPAGSDAIPTGLGLGLRGAREGMHRRITVPPDLGYGDAGQPEGGIPPGATLVFDLWIDRVRSP